jgi:hypothetical protein
MQPQPLEEVDFSPLLFSELPELRDWQQLPPLLLVNDSTECPAAPSLPEPEPAAAVDYSFLAAAAAGGGGGFAAAHPMTVALPGVATPWSSLRPSLPTTMNIMPVTPSARAPRKRPAASTATIAAAGAAKPGAAAATAGAAAPVTKRPRQRAQKPTMAHALVVSENDLVPGPLATEVFEMTRAPPHDGGGGDDAPSPPHGNASSFTTPDIFLTLSAAL